MKPNPQRAAGVSLRQALAADLTARPRDVCATSCTKDHRQIRRGDVYVTAQGEQSMKVPVFNKQGEFMGVLAYTHPLGTPETDRPF